MRQFKRPTETTIKSSDFRAELVHPRPLYQEKNGAKKLVDIYIAPTIVLLKELKEPTDGNLPIDPAMFDDAIFEKFNRITYSLGKLSRLSELNNDRLLYFIQLYFSKYNFEEVVSRNAKCKSCTEYKIKNNFTELTFGNLRRLLSCIVKTDPHIQTLDNLKTPEQRNLYTELYNDYIYDRDCYTHGKLFFLYPDFNPLLRVKPPNKEEHYVEITEECLYDNLEIYLLLDNFLSDIITVTEQNGM